jgi:hypothetical protein
MVQNLNDVVLEHLRAIRAAMATVKKDRRNVGRNDMARSLMSSHVRLLKARDSSSGAKFW